MNIIQKLFRKKEETIRSAAKTPKKDKPKTKVAAERIGELGEYKVNIQLDQFPANYKHLSDLMLENKKTRSGYSQIDHVLLTPYGLFVIETKNYAGEIKGDKQDKQWTVNKRYKMRNPFHQNYAHVEAIKSNINSDSPHSFISVISFTRRAIFSINPELRKMQSNNLCVYDTELTEFITRKIQVTKIQNERPAYKDEEIEEIYASLKKANVTDDSIREKHKQALKSYSSTEAKCEVCQTKVSQKVKQFCLTNKKFKGKVYCFEHQKTL
ncbi:nuclease-related domain-containing protein [Halobacillus sp. A5]|uniref:nuclease-related domain-containing protein n=1 Tax=Halobacillus sp. A5 TaxID=2880263 RepID=UPI0020A6693A|nr:nuclease-related domain-containing protein [Halobacillus sp. A5]MCP3028527.1 NERD domain-containing protein [Halobacillus sp. A5]